MRMQDSKSQSRFIFGREAAERAERSFKADRELLLRQFGVEIPVRDIATEQNEFRIDPCELEEIEAVASKFGPEGAKVVEFARQYVRGVGRE